MSDEVVPNLVTYVDNKRPILAVRNSSNFHFLVSLRYHPDGGPLACQGCRWLSTMVGCQGLVVLIIKMFMPRMLAGSSQGRAERYRVLKLLPASKFCEGCACRALRPSYTGVHTKRAHFGRDAARYWQQSMPQSIA
eukprot:363625-Chlamydomonas_euryale.AAC.19